MGIRKRVIAAIIGQSNEVGSGESASFTTGLGCPLRDPVKPNGSSLRSMWPRLAELMGDQGVWLNFYNVGVGSTSLAKQWVGQPQAWQSGLLASAGSMVLSGGGVWKCGLAAGSVVASTVAPTGTANTTGADSIPWSYLGAPTASDIAGRVLADGDAHFDPNGWLTGAYAGLSTATGFDEKWAFISIGQGDKTFGTVRADYAQALINTTNYFLTRSVKVAIGFTCYGTTSGLEAWYQSDLLPGWSDAVASFTGNPNVIVGANLRNALGVLAVQSGTFSPVPGLKSDQLHMNDAAYLLASAAWRDALVSAGW